MATTMTSGLRRGLVAALILALTLSGLARALASASQAEGAPGVVAGVRFPICHAGEAPADPAVPSSHDCCGACALMAAALLPAPPRLGHPAPASRFARQAPAVVRAPAIARPRDPRLSRGPPSA